jgi:licheninase
MRTSVRWQLSLPCSLVGVLCLFAPGQAQAASGLPNGRIVLKAYDGRYVSAMWKGGGEVQVFGEQPKEWEYLDVFNQSNSWELWHGSQVNFRANDGTHFLQAACGGSWDLWDTTCGVVNASTTSQLGWETFTVEKLNNWHQGGKINSGDQVAIKAFNGAYCSALNGGGSTVNCAAGQPLGWETFTVEFVDPNGGGGPGPGPGGDVPGTFTRIYREDFNADLDPSYWNEDSGFQYANSWVTNENTWVGDGTLNLAFRNWGGYTTGWASLNRWNAPFIQYGKVVARMRVDHATDVTLAALLWPRPGQGTYSQPHPCELDWFEDFDANRDGNRTPMGAFTHYGCGPSDAWETHTAPEWAAGTQWHEWSVEWTPTRLVYKVDGVVWGEVNDSSRIPHEQMYVGFMLSVYNNRWPSVSQALFQIDWLEVHSWNP